MPWNVRHYSCSFWARYAAAQETMGHRLESQASPRWATRLFNLQNAPRRKPSGAALRGVLQEPLLASEYCACRTDEGGFASASIVNIFYVRNKQKEETDFLITRDNVPWLLVEVKLSDQPVEKHHLATAEALGNIPVIQVCRQPDVARVQRERVFCLSAQRLFA
jgi:hypothetical protein